VATLSLRSISKEFSGGVAALQDFSIDVESGEFVVLLGPSGCGKTTALRIVAGLEDPTGGGVLLDGEDITDLPEGDRDVAMVFQNYALYPHMTVAENLSFPLKIAKMPRPDVEARVREVAGMLGLADLLDRRPEKLSGGQRQRVAMGRAIVRKPQVFLMDEPLSNLDAKLRQHMREELLHLQRDLSTTTLYVTHDQAEAMTLGHRIVVLRDGVLQQLGRPKDVFAMPANLFVATFVGSPAMNLLSGTLSSDGAGTVVRAGEQTVPLDDAELARQPSAKGTDGRPVVLGIRPEALSRGSAAEGRSLAGWVDTVEELGSDTFVRVLLTGVPPLPSSVRALTGVGADDSDVADLGRMTDGRQPIIGRFDPSVEYKASESVTLALRRGAVCLFDAETGLWLE
jgi:multiple sugar transport system ATP-binding protein